MRLLVISDIHANLPAFEAVLNDSKGEWDRIWFLGDLVGYGPNPNECVTLLRQYDHIALSGNHDWAVLGKLDINAFNPDARTAIEWTQTALEEDNRTFLDSLPPIRTQTPFLLAHASPRQPVWEYILDVQTAILNFAHLEIETPFCLVGHTHNPVIFQEVDSNRVVFRELTAYRRTLLDKGRYIINPGSVGQPRDSDPRAAYALLDNEAMSWEYRRVEYPVEETQEQMRQLKMPYRLVARLQYGW